MSVPVTSTEITVINKDTISDLLDKTNRNIAITDEAVDLIKEAVSEPEFDGFRFVETLATYQTALNGTRGSLTDFVNAVKFTSFLEVTEGNFTQAYIKTFLAREFVQKRMNADTSSNEYKELSYAASRYRKSPLVKNILTQAEIPLYILFQGYRYKAVKVLAETMETAKLDRDRINAADKLLTHVKPPENFQMEVDFKIDEEDIVTKYEKAMEKMVGISLDEMNKGADVEEIINVKVIEESTDENK